MALETRFSLEEMDYLKRLPEDWIDPELAEFEERLSAGRYAWIRNGLSEDPNWAQCVGHDLWVHSPGNDVVYYRHGDMVCRLIGAEVNGYLTDDDADALTDWLDAIHAHELAVR